MRVLLVYSNQARDLLPAPPIGLAYIASATRRAGHAVRVLDLLGRRRPADDLGEAVEGFGPDVVGVSVRNIDNVVHQRPEWHLGELARLLAVVRRASPAPIVLGGPAISILGATALRRLDADFALVGEGERAFPALLSAIEAGGPYGAIAGLCYRAGDGVTANAPALLPAFGASGLEDWIDWPTYAREGGTWPIQTKRGCSLPCSYCAYPAIEGRADRRRTAGDVADEIARVQAALRPRTFEFVDSTFNVPVTHAEAVCREIARRRLDVHLTAMGVNPLGVSETLFPLMRRAGFVSMMVTPEAASDVVLRNLRKGFTVAHVRETARRARASGITSAWFFMLGGPGETRETVEETVSFVERHLNWRGCLSIIFTGIRVLPGTELARRARDEARLAPDVDLAEPVFYLSPDVEEEWMLARINRAMARCPGIVHAAEEGQSTYERLAGRVLYTLGVAPPYWRFLPVLLRLPPVSALRRRHPPELTRSRRPGPSPPAPSASPRPRDRRCGRDAG